MAELTTGPGSGISHPLSLLESLAKANEWSFNRVDEDLMIVHFESSWRILSVTVSLSHVDVAIRLTCSFDLNPRKGKELVLYQLINQINQDCAAGAFTIDQAEGVVIYRNSAMLSDKSELNWQHLNYIFSEAVDKCEKYYPSFQLVNFGKSEPRAALEMVIADIQGTA